MDCASRCGIQVDVSRSQPTPHRRQVPTHEPEALEQPERHRELRRGSAYYLMIQRATLRERLHVAGEGQILPNELLRGAKGLCGYCTKIVHADPGKSPRISHQPRHDMP